MSTRSAITATLAAAAITGLLAGAAPAKASVSAAGMGRANSARTSKVLGKTYNTADAATSTAPNPKHDCKAKNDCKGTGGCGSSDNGCKGKNSCKGKGGCNTSM